MRLACRELAAWFEKNATIVTPTAFLARVAYEQFVRERLSRGVETWARPTIYGLETWLVSCWQEMRYAAADILSLLSPAQESALWHGIIEQEHPQLFDVAATVRMAREAASLLAQWNIPAEGELWSDHADAQQFLHWNRLLRRKCRENGWMTRADLARQVAAWIADGAFRPRLTVFVGFDSTLPVLESLLSALGSLSVRLPFEHKASTRTAIAKESGDLAGELEFAARRLRYLFEEKTDRSLALFVPELAECHLLVECTLRAVFFPSAAAKIAAPQSPAVESLFRVTETGRLMDHPLVASALLLLNLASPRIDHADAGAILRSPFIEGAAVERHQRALADVDLRKRRELDVSLRDMERASSACPILISCWKRVEKLVKRASAVRSLSEWNEFISNLLGGVGWPGETELTVREERIIDQWKERLSTLSGLELVTGPVTLESALGHLRRLLSVRLEQGEWSSPIHVLDARQAQGIEFDAAIAVGMSEETWPPVLRMSPLVPLRLQKRHRLPGSTPQNAREERQRLTEALFQSAPEVLVTFQKQLATAAEGFVGEVKANLGVWDGRLPRESFRPETLEQLADGQAPPFVTRGEVRGGTGIIKAQSQCPFRAFAEYRLNARSPEDASFGFDARERGGFVHKALEKVWHGLGSYGKLRSTSPEDLRLLVQESIVDAVQTRETGPLHQLSVGTERERLEALILEWLALERVRSEPFTVEMVEQDSTYEVPGLSLKLRVDRIDRLNNGNLVLIDYKSGGQTRGKLTGERPPEPQLLVYAASATSKVEGIFFGQLKPREVKAVGFSRKKQFKGQTAEEKKDWDTYIEDSRRYVEKLAQDFVRGVAEVDPIGGACEYCGNKPFCRVNERDAPREEEE
jgi:ATP-dependent helicase/nuclease subunit B